MKKSTKTMAKQTKGPKAAAAPKGAAKPQSAKKPKGAEEPKSAEQPKVERKPKAERKPAADAKPKRVSALDAAAQVLKASGQAMRAQEMIAAMSEAGLWSSPNGKTPHATLYAAILREINDKAADARFRKTGRGLFEHAG
jgi:hypothetical protein